MTDFSFQGLNWSADSSPDSVVNWAEQYRVGGLLKPMVVIRTATDQNYLMDEFTVLQLADNSNWVGYSKAMLNAVTPGMRIPGLLTWDVSEAIDTQVSTAKLELANALAISKTTTTLTQPMQQWLHSPVVTNQCVFDSNGIPQLIGANTPGNVTDTSSGLRFREEDVLFRSIANEQMFVNSIVGFPNPRVPIDESDGSNYWPVDASGSGAYFLLIDDEIVRVVDYGGNYFVIPPGGRGVNGLIQAHSAGATVSLLNFAPYTHKFTGLGFLDIDDFRPYRALLRPGTCICSYEGYGDPPQSLTKERWNKASGRNYAFTGYWFVKGLNSTLADDGVPKVDIDLEGPAHIFNSQKITLDAIQRMKVIDGSWTEAVFDEAGHYRHIPYAWGDFHQWDATLPGSYPLQIYVEFGQHKAFFDHMQESQMGKTCEFCQHEWAEYVSRHPTNVNYLMEARPVGKHIYQNSIQVWRNSHGETTAGPVKTNIRLMLALGAAAFEQPMAGNPLSQRFTKIPNVLYDNIRSLSTYKVWNGVLSTNKFYDGTQRQQDVWTNQVLEDLAVFYHRDTLLCPFQGTYDKQPFTQPAQDIADLNQMSFWITRDGYPVFVPLGFSFRGLPPKPRFPGDPFAANWPSGDWHMSWGKGIDSYTHNTDQSSVLSLAYVTGTDAWESDFTIGAAGTRIDMTTGQLFWHSSATGNPEAMQLTGGVQAVDTVSLDNVVFGMNWDTDPTGYGPILNRDNQQINLEKKPNLYDGRVQLYKGITGHKKAIIRVQRLINFMIDRFYIPWVKNSNGDFTNQLSEDGKFGPDTENGVKELQTFLAQNFPGYGTFYTGPIHGKYGKTVYHATKNWFHQFSETIKTDVWWYVMAGYDWQYYVAAITGVQVIQYKSADGSEADPSSMWMIDQLATQQNIQNAENLYIPQMINIGNKVVDESIKKSSIREITSNYADPRIEVGDVIWANVPGHLDSTDIFGNSKPPYTHGVYVTNVTRTADLTQGTYRSTFTGYRHFQPPTYIDAINDPTNYYWDDADQIHSRVDYGNVDYGITSFSSWTPN